MRRPCRAAAALCFVGALAACSGGSGPSTNRSACQQVQSVVNMLGSRHPGGSSIQSALNDAAQAAQSAPDAHLRRLATELTAAIHTKVKPNTLDFSVAGKLSALNSACQQYLK